MSNTVEKLAESVASTTGSRITYGEKTSVGGVDVIPVSLGWFGFGGGSDERGEETSAAASGGGGGGAGVPIGMIVARESGPRFEPNLVALAAVSIPLVCVLGRALARIIRAAKR